MTTHLPSLFVLFALIFGAVPHANAEDLYIKNAFMSDDFDALDILFSESLPSGYVSYEVNYHGNGYAYGSGKARADGRDSVRISGFAENIVGPGASGHATFTLRLCHDSAQRLYDDSDCEAPFVQDYYAFETMNASFNDVSPSHPHADAIAYVRKEGIVTGYPDGSFKPNITINRAEFAKIIMESNFTQQAVDDCDPGYFYFWDANKTAWYAPYLCLAAQHKIIEGYPDGSYKPAAAINFVEAAKIIALVDNFYINGVYYNNSITTDGRVLGPPLPEGRDGHWYEPSVRYLAHKNAIPLSINSLDHSLTRGEMAEIIYRLKSGNNDKSSRSYEDLQVSSDTTFYTHPDGFYTVSIPDGWQLVAEWENQVSFGQKTRIGGHGYDGELFIFMYDSRHQNVDTLAREMGAQFTDRREKRESVVVDGRSATKVTVTTPSVPGWVYEQVMVQADGWIYALSNGATPNSHFVPFYESFHLIEN